MTRALIMFISIAVLALCGCKGEKKAGGGETASNAGSSGTQQTDPPGAKTKKGYELDELDVKTSIEPATKVPADQLPTPEDYEEEAAAKVTVANMEMEMEAAEEEMAPHVGSDHEDQPEEEAQPRPKSGDPKPAKPKPASKEPAAE